MLFKRAMAEKEPSTLRVAVGDVLKITTNLPYGKPQEKLVKIEAFDIHQVFAAEPPRLWLRGIEANQGFDRAFTLELPTEKHNPATNTVELATPALGDHGETITYEKLTREPEGVIWSFQHP